MLKNSLTVIMVTPDHGMKNLHFSYRLLHICCLLMISFFVMVSLMIIDYQESQHKIIYYQTSNRYYNKALDIINAKAQEDMIRLRTVNLVVRRLNAYNENLMKMAGLPPAPLEEDEELLGMGGPVDFAVRSEDDFEVNLDINDTKELENIVFKQEKSFIHLKTFLEEQSEQLANTPSIKPVKGSVFLASRFGYRISPFSGKRTFHTGVDLSGRRGMSIIATADGEVVFASWQKGYGKLVVIKHEFGYMTRYGHNEKILVRKGDKVKRGDTVALLGSTGYSTGPHSHYEVIYNGRQMNPLNYILNWQ